MRYDDEGSFYLRLESSERTFTLWSTIISSMGILGAVVGAFTAGFFTVYSRWKCILLNNLVVVVAVAFFCIPYEITFSIGRFFYGLAGGQFSVFCPVFLNDMTPDSLKGEVGGFT